MALSALLPSAVDSRWTERELSECAYESTASIRGPRTADLLGEIDRECSELAPMLKLPLQRQGLADIYADCSGAV